VLVAVDDGSRDGTAEVLALLAEQDRRVLLVRSPGEGIPRSLNRALERCDAEMVARMDADDLSHPRRLERQLEALRAKAELWAVGCRVRAFPRRAVREGMRHYLAWLNDLITPSLVARDLLVEAPIVHPAAVIRRAVLEGLGGWREGPFAEDYDLWLRVSEAGGALCNVPCPLFLWREGAGRATRRDPRYSLERHIALKCAYLRRTHLARQQEVVLWGAGETGKAFADALAGEGIRVAYFLDVDRRKVGRTVRGARVLFFEEAGRLRGRFPLLVAVGAKGARLLIRAELVSRGFVELEDFWCVA